MRQPRISRRGAIQATGAALVSGATLATGLGAQIAAAHSAAGDLIGAWVVNSTRQGVVPNGLLYLVLPGGGFVRTSNAHPTESPGLGAWQRTGAGGYEVTYQALEFDPTGAFQGYRKSWLQLTLDSSGSSFRGRFHIVFHDAAGAESSPSDGEVSGMRIVAEAFPT